MTIIQLISALCAFLPTEQVALCEERVLACYHKQIEITSEPPKEVVRLCFGTYTENMESLWPTVK